MDYLDDLACIEDYYEEPEKNSDGEEAPADGDKEVERISQSSVIKVEAKKRTQRFNRTGINIQHLKGSRGIRDVEDYFRSIKFAGKGYEHRDLNNVMKRLEHWAHRLQPSFSFDDSIAAVEKLAGKKELQVFLSQYRLGTLEPLTDSRDDDVDNLEDKFGNDLAETAEPLDEIDALLDQQIAFSKTLNHSNVAVEHDFFGSSADTQTVPASQLPTAVPSTTVVEPLSSDFIALIAEKRRAARLLLEEKKHNNSS